MRVLVTGGAGYIGSHTVLELLTTGHEVSVVDNLCNSSEGSLRGVSRICGRKAAFYKEDIRNKAALADIFSKERPEAVIHFAGLKAVGESVEKPMLYYDNNIAGTLTLLEVMNDMGCKNMVFSSSATVYGRPESVPVREDARTQATNPYGRTKLMIENIMRDLYYSDNGWNVILLRYFNPIGAHESGLIGEDPNGIPNNLLPYIAKVAVGKLECLSVYGNDYDTPDGTGIRDYIHVVDLAKGHVKAIEKLTENPGLKIYNLGTGKGYSVLEVLEAFKKASRRNIPYVITDRRPGDVDICFADSSLAYKEMGWKAEYGIDKMCADLWNWQSKNPDGYETEQG